MTKKEWKKFTERIANDNDINYLYVKEYGKETFAIYPNHFDKKEVDDCGAIFDELSTTTFKSTDFEVNDDIVTIKGCDIKTKEPEVFVKDTICNVYGDRKVYFIPKIAILNRKYIQEIY